MPITKDVLLLFLDAELRKCGEQMRLETSVAHTVNVECFLVIHVLLEHIQGLNKRNAQTLYLGSTVARLKLKRIDC